MIEIQRNSFSSDRLHRISQALLSGPMMELRQALIAESDALLAESAQSQIDGDRAESQKMMDRARELRTVVRVLDQCASQEIQLSSVKILTKP